MAPIPVVTVTQVVRKMRGGSQAHLIRADDDRYYVVKFLNNPQHRRILINEFLSSALLQHLGLTTPPAVLVNVGSDFLQEHPELYIQRQSCRTQPTAGLHFGSTYPGSISKTVVYDFLPDVLLPDLVNVHQFCGALAFDKWTANVDARQAIFIRDATSHWQVPTDYWSCAGFRAVFIDNGGAFGSDRWCFPDSPRYGPYFRSAVYQRVRTWAAFEPWVERVQGVSESLFETLLKQMPETWLGEDRQTLQALLERLMARRVRVPDLLRHTLNNRPDSFPAWIGI